MRSNDHGSSDDTRSRGTGRVHGGAAQSAQRAGTVNAAEGVTVQHLVKRYGNVLAVIDVSFSIREGEIFGIIGPNGAGKTTSVECISGLRAPDSGSISVYGLSPQKDRNKIREVVGVQLQESALPPRLKLGEAVRLFASFYANPLDPDELLESLGIKQFENSAFKSLSGGQKQRLSIALALGSPSYAALLTMAVYTVIFGFIAIRYFRWE